MPKYKSKDWRKNAREWYAYAVNKTSAFLKDNFMFGFSMKEGINAIMTYFDTVLKEPVSENAAKGYINHMISVGKCKVVTYPWEQYTKRIPYSHIETIFEKI